MNINELKTKVWRDRILGFDDFTADDFIEMACEAEQSARDVGITDPAWNYFITLAHRYEQAAYFKSGMKTK